MFHIAGLISSGLHTIHSTRHAPHAAAEVWPVWPRVLRPVEQAVQGVRPPSTTTRTLSAYVFSGQGSAWPLEWANRPGSTKPAQAGMHYVVSTSNCVQSDLHPWWEHIVN
jgi:hypothetical protein